MPLLLPFSDETEPDRAGNGRGIASETEGEACADVKDVGDGLFDRCP